MRNISATIGKDQCVLVPVEENIVPARDGFLAPHTINVPDMACLLEYPGMKLIKGVNNVFAFELPAHVRELTYIRHKYTVPIPTLVFLWTMKGSGYDGEALRVFMRSTLDTKYAKVVAFQISNVWTDGRICFGGHGHVSTLAQAVTYFLGSPFNHHLHLDTCFIKPEAIAGADINTTQNEEVRERFFKKWSTLKLEDVTDFPIPSHGSPLDAWMSNSVVIERTDRGTGAVADRSVIVIGGQPYRAFSKDSLQHLRAIPDTSNKVLIFSRGNKLQGFPCFSREDKFVAALENGAEVEVSPHSIFTQAECYKLAYKQTGKDEYRKTAIDAFMALSMSLSQRGTPQYYQPGSIKEADDLWAKANAKWNGVIEEVRKYVPLLVGGIHTLTNLDYALKFLKFREDLDCIEAYLGGRGEVEKDRGYHVLVPIPVFAAMLMQGGDVIDVENKRISKGAVNRIDLGATHHWQDGFNLVQTWNPREYFRIMFTGHANKLAYTDAEGNQMFYSAKRGDLKKGEDLVFTNKDGGEIKFPTDVSHICMLRSSRNTDGQFFFNCWKAARFDMDAQRRPMDILYAMDRGVGATATISSPLAWRQQYIPSGSTLRIERLAETEPGGWDTYTFTVVSTPEGAEVDEKLAKAIRRRQAYRFTTRSHSVVHKLVFDVDVDTHSIGKFKPEPIHATALIKAANTMDIRVANPFKSDSEEASYAEAQAAALRAEVDKPKVTTKVVRDGGTNAGGYADWFAAHVGTV